MVKSQIVNLTSNLSSGHNLCFKCPNGSCKPILDIYVPRSFQIHKEFLNPMGFDPYNRFLKIQKSIETPTPKMGVHSGVWGFIPSHSLTLPRAWNVTLDLQTWPAHSQVFVLVTNPMLGLRHHISTICFISIMKHNRFSFCWFYTSLLSLCLLVLHFVNYMFANFPWIHFRILFLVHFKILQVINSTLLSFCIFFILYFFNSGILINYAILWNFHFNFVNFPICKVWNFSF
jgi:hypothetical protein